MAGFDDFDLHPLARAGVLDAGYQEPTPIQAKTLPITLSGAGVIGQAQTGSGKTAAFLLAVFDRLLRRPAPDREPQNPRALIVAPTRELVKQISENAALLGRHAHLRLHTVFGGLDYVEQKRSFAGGVDVLVGTPGRLIDYYKQRVYDFGALEILVVDECDRMFDLGFIDDVRWLLRRMPPMDRRQNLLFSATVDFRVRELAWEYMDDPQVVSVDPPQTPPEAIVQQVYHVGSHEKMRLMVGLMRAQIFSRPGARILVFANRRHDCERVCDYLNANGITAMALSGALSQAQRFKALDAFKSEPPPVIVATDVASRGLHIDDVTHIINWDVPANPKDYVHRIGRTARAGATGMAITLASEDTVENLPRIEEFLETAIPAEVPDESLLAEIHRPERRERRHGDGHRGHGGSRSSAHPRGPDRARRHGNHAPRRGGGRGR